MKISAIAGLAAVTLGILGAGALLAVSEPAAPVKAAPQHIASVQPAAQAAADVAATAATPAPKPADERFVIRRILPIKGPIRYGEWHWDDAGAPDGPIVITVDLDARVLSVFKGGYEIGATAVLLGTQEKPTPTGVFPITQKRARHVSNLYNAPMPYMQRLTNDGISIHATTVENGYASHGCIGTPLAFAKKLFETTHNGDKVIITRGKTAGMGDALVDS
jgi:lipoprotein-anchoring transpeptidase ErfK/SrfK